MKATKKVVALVLAGTMVLGSSLTVLAEDATVPTGTEGTGISTGHMDTNVVSYTAPTDGTVASIFNYTADPERAIDLAGKLTDNSSVTKNDAGVYFQTSGTASSKTLQLKSDATPSYEIKDAQDMETVLRSNLLTGEWADTQIPKYVNLGEYGNLDDDVKAQVNAASLNPAPEDTDEILAVYQNGDVESVTVSGSAATYASTSKALTLTVKNYVAADVAVTATPVAAGSGKTNIALAEAKTDVVDTNNKAKESDTAKLYLGLTVGSEAEKAIVEGGITSTTQVAAQADNFNAVVNDGKYEIVEKETLDSGASWTTVDIQVSGVVTKSTVTDNDVAPKIAYTWTVKKHEDNTAPSIATTSYTMAADQGVDITVSLGSGNLKATGITSITFTKNGEERTVGTDSYSLDGNTLKIGASYINSLVNGGVTSRDYTVTFNDTAATAVVVTLTKE